MPPRRGSAFCFTHDPEAAPARREARRRGGHGRRRRPIEHTLVEVDIESILDLMYPLNLAFRDVLAAEPSRQRGRDLGYLVDKALKVLEAKGLEERVAKLEAKLS